MRVLWVEDFGENSPHALCRQVFSNVLSTECRDSLAQTQTRNGLANRPHDFDTWRNWYAERVRGDIEIDIYRTAVAFESMLKSTNLLDQYDAALLDVNLVHNFFDSGMVSDIQKEKGGVWAHHRLKGRDFPAGRIALLTAYDKLVDIKNYQEECRNEGYAVPVFGKSSETGPEQWLTKLSRDDDRFLNLRRGVLDGILFAERLLTDSKSIRFNRFIDGDNVSEQDIRNHLAKVKHSLPLVVSSDNLHHQLHRLTDTLGHLWDSARPEIENEDPYYRALGWAMKNLRNWSSHGGLLDRAGVREAAFLAFSYLRTTFQQPIDSEIDSALRPYERDLLAAMGNAGELDLAQLAKRLAASYVKAMVALGEHVGEPSRLRDRKTGNMREVIKQTKFGAAVNELASAVTPSANFDFPAALCEIFLHDPLPLPHDVAKSSNQVAIERHYFRALEGNAPPAWVKALWASL